MATTKIWDGITWRDLQGPQGPEGPTAVSADAGNVAKLGTDGKVLVAQADLNAKYVEVAGDTMTGPLAVTAGATMTPPATAIQPGTVLHAVREGGSAFIETYNVGASGTTGLTFRRKAGTVAAPAPVAANTSMGVIRWQTKPSNGSNDRITAQIALAATSPETPDGYFESVIAFTTVGYAAGAPNTAISLTNAAAGRTCTINTDTFICDGKNFSVTASGDTTVTGTLSASGGDFIVTDTQVKSAVTAGDSVTAIGLCGAGVGTSATSGGVYGVIGQVTGTVSTGIGVSGNVTATATQNFGLQAIVSGGTRNCGLYVDVPKAAGSYAVQFQGDADSYFKSNVGIGWSTPTVALEVGGATKLRSTLEVVGNITSTGTAHSFSSASIPSSAVVGSTAFTPANSAAAGVAGSMRWDENFLYVRVASGWKRVALAAF